MSHQCERGFCITAAEQGSRFCEFHNESNDPKPTPPGGPEFDTAFAEFVGEKLTYCGVPACGNLTTGAPPCGCCDSCCGHARGICAGHGKPVVESTSPLVIALPVDAAKRKAMPIVRGCLDYFPSALAAIAELSRIGNEQHNKGQPMHHARGKSSDHADCIMRHLIDRGTVDTDGVRHSTKVAWRALAQLQEELEREEGVPLPRGAKVG